MADNSNIEIKTLYNEYRPKVFDDIVGQRTPVTTLKNAILSGKVASAYLFSGPRGTGKTSTARIFAKALLCNDMDGISPDGCDKCPCCEAMNYGEFSDFIEIDAASNRGIDNIRNLITQTYLSPSVSNRRVILIDEVHHLTGEASTALLKVLEEPPSNTIFLLATTDPMKLKDTIRSRCQWLRFKPLSVTQIVRRLEDILAKENIVVEEGVAAVIARQCNGGMRDALSMMDLLITYSGGEAITLAETEKCFGTISQSDLVSLCTCVLSNDIVGVLSVPSTMLENNSTGTIQEMVNAFGSILSSAILVSYDNKIIGSDVGQSAELASMAERFAKEWDIARMIRARDIIERNFWKFDNASFNQNDIYNEIMIQIIDQQTDLNMIRSIKALNEQMEIVNSKNDKELKALNVLVELMKKVISK